MKNILYFLVLIPIVAMGQTSTENYVKTITYRDANATNPKVQITYFDGLGRPKQQIANEQSSSGKDIVSHIQYDTYGRQVNDYLPYVPTSVASQDYKSSALTDLGTFYNTPTYDNTNNPFSQKQYENSPLNRVLQQAAPGNDWSMANNHTIKQEYLSNVANEVKKYSVNALYNPTTGYYTITLSNSSGTSFYELSQLYKTIIKNENWKSTDGNNNTSIEFKDKEGRLILKRNYDNNVEHNTYYVYDQFGNLTYTIPPKADAAITQTVLDDLCYQYRYDYRNRLVEKKVPGKQWEFIVYDKLDRVVATGPALTPFNDTALVGTVGWMITKYDIFNRPVYTGWEQSTTATSEGRTLKQTAENNKTASFNETKQASGTIDGIACYYSNLVMPTNFKLLSVNYYDDYTFPIAPAISFADVENQPVFYNNTNKPKGLSTAIWNRVTTTSAAILGETAYTLYDYKARPIRNYTTNYLGGYTQVDTKLDFIGKTIYTVNKHKRLSSSTEIVVTDNYTYTPQDRLFTHTHKINTMPIQLLAENTYNELGQLVSKKTGNTAAAPLQTVDYKYNIRGWLTGINDDPTGSLVLKTVENDLFAFKINYNTVQNETGYTGTALYNGNISETYWRTSGDNVLRKYGYTYDALNRLKDAIYQRPGTTVPVTNMYNENVTYDKNGNIMTLLRNGDFDAQTGIIQIDNLTYSYGTNNATNQLTKVTDVTNSNSSLGFKNGTNTDDDYSYDAYGNMIADKNKGINTSNTNPIKYNHLNLPTEIFFTSTKKINYIYSAMGVKLQKIVTSGTSVTTTDYLGGYQYENAVLKFFNTTEGYVNFDTNVFKYVFNYTDHLGNVRVSYTRNETTGLPVILEQNHYYPFGLKHTNYNTTLLKLRGNTPIAATTSIRKYRFGGKEYQDDLGVNMYDFGARNYDPAIGRWMNIDPLAETSRRFSPYTYALNNPIYFIDPDGMEAEASSVSTDTAGLSEGEGVETVIVTGDAAKAATKELDKSSSLKITRNEKTGELSASGEAKTEYDQTLRDAIDSKDITVNLHTTTSETIAIDGKVGEVVVGAYGGSSKTADGIEANQFINMNHTKKIEEGAGSKQGNLVGHEINEAFIAAKENGGINRANSVNGDMAFDKGHKEAIRIDPNFVEMEPVNIGGAKFMLLPNGNSIKLN